MRVYTDHSVLPDAARGASAAIGNFDGVHLGHQHVIDLARGRGALGIVTFEPHPRQVFAPAAAPFRLMNASARASRLEKLGVDALFQLDFAQIAPLTPEAFMADVLVGGLGLSHVVVGADFCFGKGRAGSVETLRDGGARLGFDVTIAELMETQGAEISSTAIRRALTEGRPRDAATMLGHWHRIEGPVIHGEKRGRALGYPTANMALDGLHLPRLGVYAVLVDVLDGPHAGSYEGVASLGVRPMFGGEHPNLESHLFDFEGDLYGAAVSVGLVAYLRPEATFDDLPGLIAQMDRDSAAAQEVLRAL